MIKKARNNATVRSMAAGAGALVLAIGCAGAARAGCGQPAVKPSAFLQEQGLAFGDAVRFQHASLEAATSQSDDPRDYRFSEWAVVGLWKYAFTGSDGSKGDWGFQAYHGDGTEEQSSGARPPATGYTCVGVWDRVGYHHYKLSHFAYNWDAAGTTFQGLVVIKEDITVDEPGNHMTGTFSITAYQLDGKTPYGPPSTGTVSGERVLAE